MGPYLRRYGIAATIDLPLYDETGEDFAAPVFAAGDVTVSKDGGAFANIATLPTIGSGRVLLTLDATEMAAQRVVVRFADQDGPAFAATAVVIETTHHPSAMHPETGLIYRGATSGASGANSVTLNPAPSSLPTAAQFVAENGVGAILLSYNSGTGLATFDTDIDAIPDGTTVYIYTGFRSAVTPSAIAAATRAEMDSSSTALADIITDVADVDTDVAAIAAAVANVDTDLAAVATAIGDLNDLDATAVQTAAEGALQTYLLHRLVASALGGGESIDVDSVIGQILQTGDGGFDRETDSLEAIRDLGGGGGGGGVVTGMDPNTITASALAADAVAEIVAAIRADLNANGVTVETIVAAALDAIVDAIGDPAELLFATNQLVNSVGTAVIEARTAAEAAQTAAEAVQTDLGDGVDISAAGIAAIRADIERSGGMLEEARDQSTAGAASAAAAATSAAAAAAQTDTLETSLLEARGAGFSSASDSLEAIRDAISAIGGGGGSTPAEIVDEMVARGDEIGEAIATDPRFDRLLQVIAGKWSLSRSGDTGTLTFYDTDGVTVLFTSAVAFDPTTGQVSSFTPAALP